MRIKTRRYGALIIQCVRLHLVDGLHSSLISLHLYLHHPLFYVMTSLLQRPVTVLATLSAGIGILSHLRYFIRGEHHTESWILFLVTLFTPLVIFASQVLYMDVVIIDAAWTTSIMFWSFFGGLFTSIITYRLLFHRLNKFPGPFMARISKLYHMYMVTPQLDNYLVLDRWYHKYGPFVRTG